VFACLAVAAFVAPPGPAQADPQQVCPDNFQPFFLQIYPPEIDRNGNLFVCAKQTNGTTVFIDDLL
jgi:hypothetical protein